MPEPVIIAVPPKGGSFSDVMKKLVALGWLRRELVNEIRRLVAEDKRRIKLEEGLIELWRQHRGDETATIRAADQAGHDLAAVEAAVARMRRYQDADGSSGLAFTPKAGVDRMLADLRHDPDPLIREAAMTLHLELDLTRFGRPSRMMFDHMEFDWSEGGRSCRGVLVGTEHEVTPTYLRKHKRDISLTCYDAFHNTLLDALDTGKVHNWRELMEHLIEANTDVRILGSLGLDDYLGHFVLMREERARRIMVPGVSRTWNGGTDGKIAAIADEALLIDAQYEEMYKQLLDADRNGLRWECTTEDIEQRCANEDRCAVYIVRSGSTIASTPGLCVVGTELITSETIVAVNRERLEHNQGVGLLVESLQPVADDHSDRWRERLAEKLGDKLW
jgi:hypothetical protein